MAVQFNTWAPGQVITAEKLNQMEEHIGESNALVQTEMDNMTSMQEALGFVPEYALVTTTGGSIDAEGNYTPGSATSPTFTNFFKVPKSGKILMSWKQNVNSGNNLITAYIWDATRSTYIGSKGIRAVADEGGSAIFPEDFTYTGASIVVEPGMWVRFRYPSTNDKYFVGVSFSDVYQPTYGTVDEGIKEGQKALDAVSILQRAELNPETTLFCLNYSHPKDYITGIGNTFYLNGAKTTETQGYRRLFLTDEGLVERSHEDTSNFPAEGDFTKKLTVGHTYKLTVIRKGSSVVISGGVTTTTIQDNFQIGTYNSWQSLTALKFTEESATIQTATFVAPDAPIIINMYIRNNTFNDLQFSYWLEDITSSEETLELLQKTNDAVNILQKVELNPETSTFCYPYSKAGNYISVSGNTIRLNGTTQGTTTPRNRRIFLTDNGVAECLYTDTSSYPSSTEFTKRLISGHTYKLTVLREGTPPDDTYSNNFHIGTYDNWDKPVKMYWYSYSNNIQIATFAATDDPIIINLFIRSTSFNDLRYTYWLEDLSNTKTYSLKRNPYQNIPWEQIQDVTSVTHAHILWEPKDGRTPQGEFNVLQTKYDHLAISAYHPSAPMYPLEQHFENVDSNVLSSPNAEFAGFTGESRNLHLNAVGSLYSSRTTGSDGGIGTLAEFVQEAEACMIGNGGIITINHPAWTIYEMNDEGKKNTTTIADMVNKIITIMDLSDRVAALEVWNASCEINSQTGISTEIWDGVLSLGRQIYATAVPDHYIEFHADDTDYGYGFNHMLVVNKTSEEVLAAYRTGRFYTTQYDDDLKLTYIHQNKTASSESYNDIEIQVAAEATFLFKTATRSVEITTPATSATFTPQDGDIYVRVEAYRGNNTLWTNAIML